MRIALPSRLVMTVTAATIAVTSLTAAPVYADHDRTANVAATILGLAVIGAIINDNKDDHKHKKVQRHVPQRKVYAQRHSAHKRLQKQRQRARIAKQRRIENRHKHNGGYRFGGHGHVGQRHTARN
ncbi:MAG: hypothetical protein ABJJ53_10575 [Sulfitobacter sp.]